MFERVLCALYAPPGYPKAEGHLAFLSRPQLLTLDSLQGLARPPSNAERA
jgi:hypothetical protein